MDIKVDSKTTMVFDLDDTLYNELDYLISAYKEIAFFLDKENYKFLFSLMFSMYRNQVNVFDFLVNRYKVDKKELVTKYREHQPNISLNTGVLKVLEEIKKKNGNIALITDGRNLTQSNKIKSLGIKKYFDFFSISEDIGVVKPNQLPFENVMKYFNSENYCYIADNFKKDFIAPNSLGWDSLGIIDSGKNIHSNSYQFVTEKYQPRKLIYSFSEINII